MGGGHERPLIGLLKDLGMLCNGQGLVVFQVLVDQEVES